LPLSSIIVLKVALFRGNVYILYVIELISDQSILLKLIALNNPTISSIVKENFTPGP